MLDRSLNLEQRQRRRPAWGEVSAIGATTQGGAQALMPTIWARVAHDVNRAPGSRAGDWQFQIDWIAASKMVAKDATARVMLVEALACFEGCADFRIAIRANWLILCTQETPMSRTCPNPEGFGSSVSAGRFSWVG
jgi:hypothetical protein